MGFLTSSAPMPGSGNRLGVNLSMADQQRISEMTTRQDRGALVTLAGDAVLGTVDLLDTVASSIPFMSKALGQERGDLMTGALKALDMPGLTDFYNDNKEGIEAASGIYGIIGAELVTKRFTRPAGLLMKGLKSLPYARRIATLDAQYARSMKAVRMADRELAAMGSIGDVSMTGRVGQELSSKVFQMGSKDVTRGSLWWKARGNAAMVGARNVAFTEATMALTLNQNGFLYDDDMGHNMMWMGLGLGVGAGFEVASASYRARKFVNSNEIRKIQAGAQDPGGEEGVRLLWKNRIDGKKMTKEKVDLLAATTFTGGRVTDYVTNLLVSVRNLEDDLVNPGIAGATLQGNRSVLATQTMNLANEEIKKVTIKGISTDGRTRFTTDAAGAGNHIDQIMKRDPTGFYGVEEIGAVYPGAEGMVIHQTREIRLKEQLAEYQGLLDEAAEFGEVPDNVDMIEGQIRLIQERMKWTPVPIIDGEAATLSDLRALDGIREPDLKMIQAPDKSKLWEVSHEGKAKGIGVDSGLAVYTPKNKPVESLDHYEVFDLYRAAGEAVRDIKNGSGTIPLPENPSFIQLDMAEQIARDSNGRVKIQWPAGMTRESAQVESFAQKAEILRKEMRKLQIKQVAEKGRGIDFDPAVEASRLRFKLNLPKMTAYERGVLGESEHSVERLLRGAAEFGPGEIRKMSKVDLMKAAANFKRIGDFAPSAASDFEDLMGNSFKYMKDEFGKPTTPLLTYRRPFRQVEFSPHALADSIAIRKGYTIGKMMEPATVKGQQVETFGNRITKAIFTTEDYNQASRSNELIESQIQGSVTGASSQSLVGAVTRALKPRDWTFRDNVVLQAASRVRETAERLTRSEFERDAALVQQARQSLDNPRNASSKLLANQAVDYIPGWDLKVNPAKSIRSSMVETTLPNGRKAYQFLLQPTEANKTRWRQAYNEEMPKNALLRGANGNPLALDDNALDFYQAFESLSETVRINKNQLLASQGLKEIDYRPFYIPPPNIDGKFIGFTQDAEGNVVSGMTVIANTKKQFDDEAARIKKMIAENGSGYVFRTRDEIQQFADIWDRAHMDMIDPGTTAIQGGKQQKGLLTGPDIDMNGVDGILESMRSQYFQHSRDIVSQMFKDSIKASKMRDNVSAAVTRNNRSTEQDQRFRTIHALYQETLLGKSPLQSSGSFFGTPYNWVEGNVDRVLAEFSPKVAVPLNFISQFMARAWDAGRGKAGLDPKARKDFDSMLNALGPHMPFEKAHEYVRAKGAGSMPPTMAGIMNETNKFTAAVMLRIFEPAMAVMNMAGMVNAMPAVVRHMNRLPNETVEAHAERVGHLATLFPAANKDGSSLGVLDMSKVMARAFKRAWSKESHEDYDYMRRMGYLTQEVAEFQKQFGAIDSKGAWSKFFGGSDIEAASQRAKGTFGGKVKGRLYDKGVVGWTSILTDKSEDFSRSWGHMAGLEIAEMLGMKDLAGRNAFAHDMANKMIANYNPANRPEVFQGALGAPIGLFQSFILNYYTRMFRYIETKDYRSLATQYAMQSSLFGVTTVPGFSEAASFFFNNSDGETDFTDGIYKRFGQSAGDVLMGGTLSNLPKIFGAGGVDLYSRGDTNIRLPAIEGMPPGLSVATKVIDGVSAGIRLFSDANPALTSQQVAEVLSNTVPNRPLTGMIEQAFAGGYDTDPMGQIASDTQSMSESVYRILGVRSMRQSKELDAFYSNKSAMELKAGQDDLLRTATRAAIRGGNMDAVPQIFERYLSNGGDPRYFKRWIKGNYEAATSSRAERQLDDMMKDPNKMGMVARLLDAEVGVGEDEATESYSDSLESPSNFDGPQDEMIDYGTQNTQVLR